MHVFVWLNNVCLTCHSGGDQHWQHQDCRQCCAVRDCSHRVRHQVREWPQGERPVAPFTNMWWTLWVINGHLVCSTGTGCEHLGKVSPEQRQEHSVGAASCPVSLSTSPRLSRLFSLGYFNISIPQGGRQTDCGRGAKPPSRLLSAWAH